MAEKSKISPGMQQYLAIKADYPDAFLLFRMGDFYELFYDDAVNAAQILELTLTSRNKDAENPVPMAGVPWKAVDEYIARLVELGHKVAIADQLEDPKDAVGIVKRGVTQVVTPGTYTESLSAAANNFLVSVDKLSASGGISYQLAYLDLGTGEFRFTELSALTEVLGEIASLKAREIVVGFELTEQERSVFTKRLNLVISEQFDGADACDKLLKYVTRTQLRDLTHIKAPEFYELAQSLQMSFETQRALELVENARDGKKSGTLYGVLDQTKTAMGTRLLKAWLLSPLISRTKIETRQEIVQILLDNFFERADLIESLRGVYDLERLASRVSFGKAVPVDLTQLANSLSHVPAIKTILSVLAQPVLEPLIARLDEVPELSALIERAIEPTAMRVITDGAIIKTGYNAQLDTYREALSNGASWISELEAKERAATGITGLRIDYNRQDGYYFHVTASQIPNIPAYFIYKKALKNATRYTTKELAEIEETMLEARAGSSTLEYNLFCEIRETVKGYIPRLQALARAVASIDVLQSFATVAEKNKYQKPNFNDSHQIAIKNGRHAVVESVLGAQEYVPNDLDMPENTAIQLITGPNMSGKSTYMRQLAQIVVMAQMGSFVAAQTAELPLFDAIFTRIGASDNLIGGESTFMVEMSEANVAIARATQNSLILFDELGRGTATYDGLALAQSIIEYIHDNIGAKTLFATHYHELTALDKTLVQLTNVHVATLEQNGEVTFLHKILPGPADKSYGIHVARIAGLPQSLLMRADSILQKLESQEVQLAPAHQAQQLELFASEPENRELTEKLAALDINQLTPLEALQKLSDLKGLLS
ncbi:MAG: DNA mismatch repair protein MutS [Streptococcaceae bacterium]|jgi:DNA mismatch repair protein MutS|nr:DNA mismatch repair protein MutS [Streptococcaceae bacterium]